MDDAIGERKGLVRDAFRFAPEDKGQGLGVIQFGIGDGLAAQSGHDDLEPLLLQGLETLGRRGVDRDLEPLVGPGRDGLVQPEEVGVRRDEVEVQDAGGVAGPDDGAGVVGDGHALEDDPEVGLAGRQDPGDPLDASVRGHGEVIAESCAKGKLNEPQGSGTREIHSGDENDPEDDRSDKGPLLLVLPVQGPAEGAVLIGGGLPEGGEKERHALPVGLIISGKEGLHPLPLFVDHDGIEDEEISREDRRRPP